MSKKRNNRGKDKEGGEPASTTKSGKNQRAKTVDASTRESTLPNATNLGHVFDEAANNNDIADPENSLAPDAPAADVVEDQQMDMGELNTSNIGDSAIAPDVNAPFAPAADAVEDQQMDVGELNTSNIVDSAITPDVNDVDTHSTDSITAPLTENDVYTAEPYNYDLPFTIFDRFIASNCPWAVDKQPSNAQQLFSASGERRRKEVKDDFEQILPLPERHTHPSTVSLMAYK